MIRNIMLAETSQNICLCGVKHDEFVSEVGTFQFCPAANQLTVFDQPEKFCTVWDLEDHVSCVKPHKADKHDHKLGKELVCTVSDCGVAYVGGVWEDEK